MKFRIEPLITGKRAIIYTVHFENELYSETEKFLDKHSTTHTVEVQRITEKLVAQAERQGLIFFEEQKPEELLYKMKLRELRLYGLKYGKIAVICGGGGVKTEYEGNKHPDIKKEKEFLGKLFKEIEKRIANEEIVITNFELKGISELDFEL